MNDIEINNLLNDLHLNNQLLRKIITIQDRFYDLESFIKENKSIKVQIGLIEFDESVKLISKYSLFIIDKIIDITDQNGKHIYNRKDLINL